MQRLGLDIVLTSVQAMNTKQNTIDLSGKCKDTSSLTIETISLNYATACTSTKALI